MTLRSIALGGAIIGCVACTSGDRAAGSVADSIATTTGASTVIPPTSDSVRAGVVSDTGWTVDATGVHGARIGASASAARLALGLTTNGAPGGECAYLDVAALPVQLKFMTVRDTLVRIDVRDSTVATREGARIGDTEARIRTLYGPRVSSLPHKYTAGGHYLTVAIPGDSGSLMVFETDGQRVTTYRVGRKPAVQYVEGCA